MRKSARESACAPSCQNFRQLSVMSKAPRRSLVPSASKTSGSFFCFIASRVLRAKTGIHAGRPFSFTFYITAESESSYSAISIVHLVYSMCQIFSSSSPVLFLVPGGAQQAHKPLLAEQTKMQAAQAPMRVSRAAETQNQPTRIATNTLGKAAARGKHTRAEIYRSRRALLSRPAHIFQ